MKKVIDFIVSVKIEAEHKDSFEDCTKELLQGIWVSKCGSGVNGRYKYESVKTRRVV